MSSWAAIAEYLPLNDQRALTRYVTLCPQSFYVIFYFTSVFQDQITENKTTWAIDIVLAMATWKMNIAAEDHSVILRIPLTFP